MMQLKLSANILVAVKLLPTKTALLYNDYDLRQLPQIEKNSFQVSFMQYLFMNDFSRAMIKSYFQTLQIMFIWLMIVPCLFNMLLSNAQNLQGVVRWDGEAVVTKLNAEIKIGTYFQDGICAVLNKTMYLFHGGDNYYAQRLDLDDQSIDVLVSGGTIAVRFTQDDTLQINDCNIFSLVSRGMPQVDANGTKMYVAPTHGDGCSDLLSSKIYIFDIEQGSHGAWSTSSDAPAPIRSANQTEVAADSTIKKYPCFMYDEYDNRIITILEGFTNFYAYNIETNDWTETDIPIPSTLSEGTSLCMLIQDPSLTRDFSDREIIIFADDTSGPADTPVGPVHNSWHYNTIRSPNAANPWSVYRCDRCDGIFKAVPFWYGSENKYYLAWISSYEDAYLYLYDVMDPPFVQTRAIQLAVSEAFTTLTGSPTSPVNAEMCIASSSQYGMVVIGGLNDAAQSPTAALYQLAPDTTLEIYPEIIVDQRDFILNWNYLVEMNFNVPILFIAFALVAGARNSLGKMMSKEKERELELKKLAQRRLKREASRMFQKSKGIATPDQSIDSDVSADSAEISLRATNSLYNSLLLTCLITSCAYLYLYMDNTYLSSDLGSSIYGVMCWYLIIYQFHICLACVAAEAWYKTYFDINPEGRTHPELIDMQRTDTIVMHFINTISITCIGVISIYVNSISGATSSSGEKIRLVSVELLGAIIGILALSSIIFLILHGLDVRKALRLYEESILENVEDSKMRDDASLEYQDTLMTAYKKDEASRQVKEQLDLMITFAKINFIAFPVQTVLIIVTFFTNENYPQPSVACDVIAKIVGVGMLWYTLRCISFGQANRQSSSNVAKSKPEKETFSVLSQVSESKSFKSREKDSYKHGLGWEVALQSKPIKPLEIEDDTKVEDTVIPVGDSTDVDINQDQAINDDIKLEIEVSDHVEEEPAPAFARQDIQGEGDASSKKSIEQSQEKPAPQPQIQPQMQPPMVPNQFQINAFAHTTVHQQPQQQAQQPQNPYMNGMNGMNNMNGLHPFMMSPHMMPYPMYYGQGMMHSAPNSGDETSKRKRKRKFKRNKKFNRRKRRRRRKRKYKHTNENGEIVSQSDSSSSSIDSSSQTDQSSSDQSADAVSKSSKSVHSDIIGNEKMRKMSVIKSKPTSIEEKKQDTQENEEKEDKQENEQTHEISKDEDMKLSSPSPSPSPLPLPSPSPSSTPSPSLSKSPSTVASAAPPANVENIAKPKPKPLPQIAKNLPRLRQNRTSFLEWFDDDDDESEEKQEPGTRLNQIDESD